MSCTALIRAFRVGHSVRFDPQSGGEPFFLPCGQCFDCRLQRSRDWSVRIMHEASSWPSNLFLTLTYSPEHLPFGDTLVKKHLQDFFKRLRKHCGHKIRYYAVGEYGERSGRSHYHVCAFNLVFSDMVLYRRTPAGSIIYKSATLDKIWGKGLCSIGALNAESAAYAARYCMKKLNGPKAEEYQNYCDLETGEIVYKVPEFALMSLKPGIGESWWRKYGSEVDVTDSVVLKGKEFKPPRYYDKLLERENPSRHAQVKYDRLRSALENWPECLPERLEAKAIVSKARMRNHQRSLE